MKLRTLALIFWVCLVAAAAVTGEETGAGIDIAAGDSVLDGAGTVHCRRAVKSIERV